MEADPLEQARAEYYNVLNADVYTACLTGVRKLAQKHFEWNGEEPYKRALSDDIDSTSQKAVNRLIVDCDNTILMAVDEALKTVAPETNPASASAQHSLLDRVIDEHTRKTATTNGDAEDMQIISVWRGGTGPGDNDDDGREIISSERMAADDEGGLDASVTYYRKPPRPGHETEAIMAVQVELVRELTGLVQARLARSEELTKLGISSADLSLAFTRGVVRLLRKNDPMPSEAEITRGEISYAPVKVLVDEALEDLLS